MSIKFINLEWILCLPFKLYTMIVGSIISNSFKFLVVFIIYETIAIIIDSVSYCKSFAA